MKDKATIPTFASHEEEAAFWDTHDVSDYWDALEPVQVRYTKKSSTPISIRFENDVMDQIRILAQEKGIGTTTLIRTWAMERLREEKVAKSSQ